MKTLLKCESLLFLISFTVMYFYLEGSLILFLLLFFVPDISMIGYFINPKYGAIGYNLIHSYILPLTLFVLTIFFSPSNFTTLLLILLIWLAHIAFDRILGYGLKYFDAFKHTRLN